MAYLRPVNVSDFEGSARRLANSLNRKISLANKRITQISVYEGEALQRRTLLASNAYAASLNRALERIRRKFAQLIEIQKTAEEKLRIKQALDGLNSHTKALWASYLVDKDGEMMARLIDSSIAADNAHAHGYSDRQYLQVQNDLISMSKIGLLLYHEELDEFSILSPAETIIEKFGPNRSWFSRTLDRHFKSRILQILSLISILANIAQLFDFGLKLTKLA